MTEVTTSADVARRKTSDSQEWYTPSEHLELVREVLGTIDLDPASSEFANQFVQAKAILTAAHFNRTYDLVEEGGYGWWLERDVPATVYCNPPYGGLAAKFTRKLLAEYKAQRVSAAILTVSGFAYETKWFRAILADKSIPICWVHGRVRFSRWNNGKEELEGKDSTVGTVYCYLGPDVARFTEVFERIGTVR